MKPRILAALLWVIYAGATAAPERLVSLAPHTTELVYSLEAGHKLLAVSDYSDYPEPAKSLPRVASSQGVDFEALMRLQPDLILAWQGGNKPQDLQRLQSLGFKLFLSHPDHPADIAEEVLELGRLLDKQELAARLANDYLGRLSQLEQKYQGKDPVRVLYYMWPSPMMSIGPGAWASKLLNLCHAENVFSDSPSDYPEVTLEGVVQRRPQVIVGAIKQPLTSLQDFWQPWLSLLELYPSSVRQVNPDPLHRFSLRQVDGIESLCRQIHL
ncbi:cobalamin-binding protein [Bowmanella dokdonensis]|uniref:Cobalamin-binding protein n=1 Tax=Bowmanella dokdonensis TaxID=751969 RepID=A0A939IPI5_9ALTE|nr:cobalamin-binding protein [Bowmanella dokdonensis]MBN7824024.1 cobalamin-binding protein [Bowmanella dokdonensis]